MGEHLYRVGLIVPSSNTTMETELPELFRRPSAPDREWRKRRRSLRSVYIQESLKRTRLAGRVESAESV
jgi:maleate isomerase